MTSESCRSRHDGGNGGNQEPSTRQHQQPNTSARQSLDSRKPPQRCTLHQARPVDDFNRDLSITVGSHALYLHDRIADTHITDLKQSIITVQAMPASAQVMQIWELLEMILLHVPVQNVLLWQRVSKNWQKFIRNTPSLQYKIFFKPQAPKNMDMFMRKDMVYNPFFSFFGATKCLSDVGNSRCMSIKPTELEKLDSPSASWKKMFLTEPCCKKIYLHNDIQYRQDLGIVSNDDGIMMGQLRKRQIESGNWGGQADDWDLHLSIVKNDWFI